MSTITVKQHDAKRTITDTLTLDGDAIDLTGATVYLVLKNTSTGAATKKLATIETATAGKVSCELEASDTTTAVVFDAEWEINFPDGAILTVPDNDYHTIRVMADLG